MSKQSFRNVKLAKVTWLVKGEAKTWTQTSLLSDLYLAITCYWVGRSPRCGCDYHTDAQTKIRSLSIITKLSAPLCGLAALVKSLWIVCPTHRVSPWSGPVPDCCLLRPPPHTLGFLTRASAFQSESRLSCVSSSWYLPIYVLPYSCVRLKRVSVIFFILSNIIP